MRYTLIIRPRAYKDLAQLSHVDEERILDAIEKLKDNLTGDVKRLRNFSPGYRLRVGDYRVLFEVEKSAIAIHRVRHRREVYRN